MTVSVVSNYYDIFPKFHFEEADRLRAGILNQETELWLKNRIYELLQETMELEIAGTPEEIDKKLAMQNFMKGKIEAFKELLENSRDCKNEATLQNQS